MPGFGRLVVVTGAFCAEARLEVRSDIQGCAVHFMAHHRMRLSHIIIFKRREIFFRLEVSFKMPLQP